MGIATATVNPANTPPQIAGDDPQGLTVGPRSTSLIGFYGATPVVKPTVTGSKAGNAALTSLMTTLAAMGLVVDGTS